MTKLCSVICLCTKDFNADKCMIQLIFTTIETIRSASSICLNPNEPALKKYVFYPVFCSLHSSPTQWALPLTPHRFGPSYSLSSYQRSRSHKSRCRILCTAFCFSGFAFNNRGFCYPPRCWHLEQRSIYLHRCPG